LFFFWLIVALNLLQWTSLYRAAIWRIRLQ